MEYTALGDTVNVAVRIVRLTRELKRNVIIGESVYLEKFKDFAEDPIALKLKGKTNEIIVYPLRKSYYPLFA